MIKKIYPIQDCDIPAVVYETKRQKDILDILDEMIENSEMFGWSYVFDSEFFYIEYRDGTTYEALEDGSYGNYKRKNIVKIIYTNAIGTLVYGDYDVNEYGCVS